MYDGKEGVKKTSFGKLGNQTSVANKSSSMKRASQVSESSDIYIIPTPPASSMSNRRSDSQNPISPSYVTESEFLGKQNGVSRNGNPIKNFDLVETDDEDDDDDSAFLSNSPLKQSSNESRRIFQQRSDTQSSIDSYDDVIHIRQRLEIDRDADVVTTSSPEPTTSDRDDTPVSTGECGSFHNQSHLSLESQKQSSVQASTFYQSDSRQQRPIARPRKPFISPRRSTLSSSASDTSDISLSPRVKSPPVPPRRFALPREEVEANNYVIVEKLENETEDVGDRFSSHLDVSHSTEVGFKSAILDCEENNTREHPVISSISDGFKNVSPVLHSSHITHSPPTIHTPHSPHTAHSPLTKHVSWKHGNEQTSSDSNLNTQIHNSESLTQNISTSDEQTQAVRKPPVPKPRKNFTKLRGKSLNSMSHLSTSEGDITESLTQSLELKDSRVRSRSTHTIVFNGEEVGVTDV